MTLNLEMAAEDGFTHLNPWPLWSWTDLVAEDRYPLKDTSGGGLTWSSRSHVPSGKLWGTAPELWVPALTGVFDPFGLVAEAWPFRP